MDQDTASMPLTIRTAKQTVSEIDTLAAAQDRSRNYIINQAIQQYLETNNWQIERIKTGLAAAAAGRVQPADQLFGAIARKHNWNP